MAASIPLAAKADRLFAILTAGSERMVDQAAAIRSAIGGAARMRRLIQEIPYTSAPAERAVAALRTILSEAGVEQVDATAALILDRLLAEGLAAAQAVEGDVPG